MKYTVSERRGEFLANYISSVEGATIENMKIIWTICDFHYQSLSLITPSLLEEMFGSITSS